VTLAFPVLKCCVHPKQIANEHSHWPAVSFTLAGIVFGVRTRTERRVLMLTVILPAVKD
jgi:TRAP-type C4-dicarboxylate transport system permease small subunit